MSSVDSSAQAEQAIQLYYAQLALNLLWTPLFFGGERRFWRTLNLAKQKEAALANIVALTGTVVAMTVGCLIPDAPLIY